MIKFTIRTFKFYALLLNLLSNLNDIASKVLNKLKLEKNISWSSRSSRKYRKYVNKVDMTHAEKRNLPLLVAVYIVVYYIFF